MSTPRETPGDKAGHRYRRPIVVSIIGSMLAEVVIFVVWGVVLYPGGDLTAKFLWSVVFCGVGMGSVVAAVLVLFVVDRFDGARAIAATALVSTVVLGGVCNALCYRLDTHVFHYFGGRESPLGFLGGGAVLASVGGVATGWLLFTERGKAFLERVGL